LVDEAAFLRRIITLRVCTLQESALTMRLIAVAREADDALESLLVRCGAGDRVAFRQLYDLKSGRLYGLALRLTRQPQLAADAVHDTLLQVWQRSARFDPSRGAAEAWLFTLLRYRTIDVLRRYHREDHAAEPPDVADKDPDALALLSASEDGAALHRCLEALEATQRRAVTLAFLDGLSHSELATRLQVPLGTIKSWVRRALQSLRRCLET
jgi:RNA polymerase sigma-70 factor, ECF subfamily